MRNFFLCLSLILCTTACQKKAALAPAGDPQSVLSPLPMGATVYNDELQKELTTLEDLCDGRLDKKQVDATTKALMVGRAQEHANLAINLELSNLFLTLPELIHGHKAASIEKKLWYKAKLLFLRRRFIESSKILTEILEKNPNFAEARNLRARAIFFLGNPDLAVKELQYIVATNEATSAQSLEALYLIGAIIYEDSDLDKEKIATGIEAWQRYLKLAQTDPAIDKEINNGLSELLTRKNEKPENKVPLLDPFSPREGLSAEKNAVLTAFMKEELLLALELCDKSLKKSYDKDLAIIKARIFIKTGRMDEAAELFTAIVEKNATYAPAFHYRGMIFMLKGQPKDAITSWQKTLELDQRYALSHKLDQRIARAEKMLQPEKIATH